MVKTIREFLLAVYSDWIARMSGIASLSIALLISWLSPAYVGLWWFAAYLCLLVAAFRVWRTGWQEAGPEVIAVYENTTETERDLFSPTPKSPKNGPAGVVLQNLSDIPALNAQINDLDISGFVVGFQLIPRVIKGSPVTASVVPKDALSKSFLGDFGVILEFVLEASKKELIKVPLTVSYEDMRGRRFETGCEIQFSATSHRAIKKHYRRLVSSEAKV